MHITMLLLQLYRQKSEISVSVLIYEGRTESHEQQFFSRELGTADEGE